MEITLVTGCLIFIIAFFAELTDSTLGMGYGTALTPILLFMGFQPLEVVPAILVSEFVTGILAGIAHQSLGNLTLITPKPSGKITGSQKLPLNWIKKIKGLNVNMKSLIAISSFGVGGTILAVALAIKLPAFYVKLYIGILITAIGILLFLTNNKTYHFSWKRLSLMGIMASFNKGISGGGYGPLITGGQILSGIPEKTAIGITSISEGLSCFVGIIIYLAFRENPFQSSLLPLLVCAGTLSVPFSAFFVSKIDAKKLRWSMAWITLGLGIFTLIKLILSN